MHDYFFTRINIKFQLIIVQLNDVLNYGKFPERGLAQILNEFLRRPSMKRNGAGGGCMENREASNLYSITQILSGH